MKIQAIIVAGLLGLGSGSQCQEPIIPPRGDDEAWFLIGLLAEEGIDAEVGLLAEAARSHEDAHVRWIAIELLAKWRPEQFTELFATILDDDKDRLVRETAAMGLLEAGDERGASALRHFLKDAQPPRDLAIASRLAEAKDYTGYKVVKDAAQSDIASRRADAARTLPLFIHPCGEVGEEGVTATILLLALVKDPAGSVRKAALEQLAMAVSQGLDPDQAEMIARDFVSSDSVPEVREAARMQLQLLQNPKLEPPHCDQSRKVPS